MKKEKVLRKAIKQSLGITKETLEIRLTLDNCVNVMIATENAYKSKNSAKIAVETAKKEAKLLRENAQKIMKDLKKLVKKTKERDAKCMNVHTKY